MLKTLTHFYLFSLWMYNTSFGMKKLKKAIVSLYTNALQKYIKIYFKMLKYKIHDFIL